MPAATEKSTGAAFRVLVAISFCHLLNDTMQSVVPALYPVLKAAFHLDFGQIGLITLTSNLTASMLQPAVGYATDRRAMPFILPAGMCFTLCGLLLLGFAPHYAVVLLAVGTMGIGSAIFHPESSRVARLASGGRHGMAQSLFQVGGNCGSSMGPLLAAFVIAPNGQRSVAWLAGAALVGIAVLGRVASWHRAHRRAAKVGPAAPVPRRTLSRARVGSSLAVLAALVFSKYFYLASLVSYYEFFLMTRFRVSIENAQVHLFVFLGAVALGTYVGGPVGDRIGRKYVIWSSILGVLPFTLLLPYASLFWTGVLSVLIGFVLASAFSAILVYAQDLVPGRVGAISGLFFGLAFGMGGIGAALLGQLADRSGIEFVYRVCSFLPALGLLTAFLPNLEPRRR